MVWIGSHDGGQPYPQHPYSIETIRCCGSGFSGICSFLLKPAASNISLSSANVYASPAGVAASITRLNMASDGGDTRSSLGTNSRVIALPPSALAAFTL